VPSDESAQGLGLRAARLSDFCIDLAEVEDAPA